MNSQVPIVSSDMRSNTVRLWRKIKEHRPFRVGLLMTMGAASALCCEAGVRAQHDFKRPRAAHKARKMLGASFAGDRAEGRLELTEGR